MAPLRPRVIVAPRPQARFPCLLPWPGIDCGRASYIVKRLKVGVIACPCLPSSVQNFGALGPARIGVSAAGAGAAGSGRRHRVETCFLRMGGAGRERRRPTGASPPNGAFFQNRDFGGEDDHKEYCCCSLCHRLCGLGADARRDFIYGQARQGTDRRRACQGGASAAPVRIEPV